jgi:allantoicase
MKHSDENPKSGMGGDHSTADFTALADLASARVGGRALAASDDFFASKANLLKPEPAVFIPGKYTSRGKWMDGWESRRQRTPGFDWCVIQLGMRGIVRGVDVDTSFFTGNYPSQCSVEAVDVATAVPSTSRGSRRPAPTAGDSASGVAPRGRIWHPPDGRAWTPLLRPTALSGHAHHLFATIASEPCTHVRLNIYPDGGVARLRVYGDVVVDWERVRRAGRAIDLASIRNGGLVLGASDMHFGAKDNMIMPGRAANMGDGWETRRRRGPGHDWAIVRLGAPGIISRVELDTNHFKGNYPDSASLEACLAPGAPPGSLETAAWSVLLPPTKLKAHHRHFFSSALARLGPVSHVRLNIFPDGGVSRLRIHGTVAPP